MITIPNPCSENWGKMNKTEKGRFCNSCNKQVIDFSKMKNEKIEVYFENNQTDEICGNFKTSQIQNIQNPKFKFKWAALFMVFISFLFSSCVEKVKGKIYKPINYSNDTNNSSSVNRTMVIPNDTIHRSSLNTTMGLPSYVKPVKKNKIVNDTTKK